MYITNRRWYFQLCKSEIQIKSLCIFKYVLNRYFDNDADLVLCSELDNFTHHEICWFSGSTVYSSDIICEPAFLADKHLDSCLTCCTSFFFRGVCSCVWCVCLSVLLGCCWNLHLRSPIKLATNEKVLKYLLCAFLPNHSWDSGPSRCDSIFG